MIKSKFDEDSIIHKTYKKSRLIVFILFLFVICFMSIGYASLNSILEVIGYLNLNGDVGDLEIISINLLDNAVNGTSNGASFNISGDSNDEIVTLIAEFDMSFYRTMGSSNSLLSYDIVIKNNSLTERKLTSVNSDPSFNNGNSTLNYEMSGITFETTIISPGDSVTVNLTFSLGQFDRYTNYNVYEVFKFVFAEVTEDDFKLSLSLTTTSVEFSTFDDIVSVSAVISNISAQDITYVFEVNDSNFEIVNSTGEELSAFTVSAFTTANPTFYLKVAENHIFADVTDVIEVTLLTTGPSILSYDLGDIEVIIPKDNVQEIIGSETIFDDSTIDFTQTSSISGLYKNSVNGDVTYFYRGNVKNNYVSFAGFTWRIIRIDKYGVRVILNDVIDTIAAWNVNPGVNAELAAAISKLTYDNSSVKPVVENWYNANLTNYSSTIKSSLFCIDTSYQTMTSSGNYGVTVYYFGSYIRNGTDSTAYTPEFVCDSQYTRKYNIGLISGDEVAFAGGVFNTNNTNYYLYDNSVTTDWWTMSPSYYDSSLGTVGMLLVNGYNGKFYDWPNGSTIENSFGIRPVITLDTDKIIGGSGIIGDEYTFSS